MLCGRLKIMFFYGILQQIDYYSMGFRRVFIINDNFIMINK